MTGAAPAGARVAAQAKVNLRLRILAREESGFHQIETLFLRLALADQVRVRRTTGARSLDVHGADAAALGPVEGNLAWRAAVAYAEAGAWTGGFAIELEKWIPVGGGLGGGSADAAGVLRVMNAIAPHPLDVGTLLRLAATLGADVPFLVSDLAYALAWGRGERLLALAPPPVREVVLLVPPFGVNTAAAYGWLAASRSSSAAPVLDGELLDPAALARWETIAPLAVNDFEPVVAARHPAIASLVGTLRASGCTPALMSGSGSVVFGVVPPGIDPAVVRGDPTSRTVRTRTSARVEPVEALD